MFVKKYSSKNSSKTFFKNISKKHLSKNLSKNSSRKQHQVTTKKQRSIKTILTNLVRKEENKL